MKIRVLPLIWATSLALWGCAGFAPAAIIMDQIGPTPDGQAGQLVNSSQDFEGSLDAFDIAFIDDFSVAGLTQLETIEAVFAGLGNFTGYANVQSWRIEIFSSSAAAVSGLTGDVASVNVPIANASMIQPWVAVQTQSAKVSLDVSAEPSLNLPAGTYWIGVIAVHNFGGGSQIGIYDSIFVGSPSNSNSRQVNPGGGFGLAGNERVLNTNAALRITGSSGGSIPPSLVGLAVPLTVAAGEMVTLTANVTPGANPASTGLTVSVDLTQIGGAANVPMSDLGGNVFSVNVTVGANPPCGNILLPATVIDDQLRVGNGNIPLQPVGSLTPTPGATPDAEPDCGDPADTVNGGCNVTPNVFGALNCGQTVQGTVRASTTTRDTDWYSFTLAAETVVSWSVIGQADMIFGFVRDTAALTTPPVCGSPTLAINPVDTTIPCQCGTVSVTLGAGTWWTFVSTPEGEVVACGRTYEATLRCGAACPGDVNGDGNRDGRDVQAFVNSYPGCFAGAVTNCTACSASDVNGDSDFTAADVTELIDLLLAGDACP